MCSVSWLFIYFVKSQPPVGCKPCYSHSHHGLDLILRGFIFFFLMVPPPSEEMGWNFRIGNGTRWRHRDDGDGV